MEIEIDVVYAEIVEMSIKSNGLMRGNWLHLLPKLSGA